MSSVFYSNELPECEDVTEDERAAGIAVLSVVVVSFLMSCTVIVITIVNARVVVKRGSVNFDVVVVTDDDVYATIARRRSTLAKSACQPETLSRRATSPDIENDADDANDVFDEDDEGLDTLYDKPTTDAEKMYGPIKIRMPRRSSSIFPPIDEDRATSGDESCKSFAARGSSCASGYNCQHRGTLARSSASSGILKTRKSSDVLQLPFADHGALVRTRSQEQVARITELLFSGKSRQDLLDPNNILGDDGSRRASSTSSGRRKKSLDHLLVNFALNQEAPGSTKSQRRRESTPILGTSSVTGDEKVLKRSITSSEFGMPASPSDVSSTTNEMGKRRGRGVSKLVKEFEKFATVRSRHFFQSESVIEETDSSQTTLDSTSFAQAKNIFVKNNNRKVSSTMPANKNLPYLKQFSVADNPVYRRQRRSGIHVETSNSTDV